MGGAIAGTSILKTEKNDILQLIALTVNNLCNLSCGHCYLQDGVDSSFVSDDVIEKVIDSSAEYVALVGKEPGVHVDETSELIEKLTGAGKKVSLISNGLLLHKFDTSILDKLDSLDISMDGGPKTYSRGNYSDVLEALSFHPNATVLHTLYEENVSLVEDMLDVPHDRMMFSPYLITQNKGENTVEQTDLEKILSALSQSNIRSHDSAFMLVDGFHLGQNGMTNEEFVDIIANYDLDNHIKFYDSNPLHHGIVRVTYDGLLMTPEDSLHPMTYRENSVLVGNIDEQYEQLLFGLK